MRNRNRQRKFVLGSSIQFVLLSRNGRMESVQTDGLWLTRAGSVVPWRKAITFGRTWKVFRRERKWCWHSGRLEVPCRESSSSIGRDHAQNCWFITNKKEKNTKRNNWRENRDSLAQMNLMPSSNNPNFVIYNDHRLHTERTFCIVRAILELLMLKSQIIYQLDTDLWLRRPRFVKNKIRTCREQILVAFPVWR